MVTKKSLNEYKEQLKKRYLKLIELSNEYRYIDEQKSDSAAFKAMKVSQKINKVDYLERKIAY